MLKICESASICVEKFHNRQQIVKRLYTQFMMLLALKMLIGNRASCLGVIFGIFLATLLISQQSAIFLGLLSRSYRLVTDIPAANVWVVDPITEGDEKIREIPVSYLNIVRGLPGIEWAEPIHVMDVPLITQTGIFQICQLYGIDEATFIGAPPEIIEGNLLDLRREGGVIVDQYAANNGLAQNLPDGTKIPLNVGDSLEINHKKAMVVGICKTTLWLYPRPIIFTSESNFKIFTSTSGNMVSFIAARASDPSNITKVIEKIDAYSAIKGLNVDQFKWKMVRHLLKTGIAINFALSVALGIIIGFSISGQIFYHMTLQNLPYYALIKALGGNKKLISRMIIVQVIVVGTIGFLCGIGATILWGMAVKNTTLAFLFPWQLLIFSGLIATIICLFSAFLSIRKVIKTDPKLLMST